MRKVLLLATILFVTSISANAQDEYPKFEFWGTYSLLVADIDFLDDESLHGYGLGAQYNINRTFGLVAEFTSNHGASGPVSIPINGGIVIVPKLDTRFNAFLFGPRVSYRTKAVTAFAHFLLGGANSKLDAEGFGVSDSNTEFAMAIGGGIDINIGKYFAIRAAQFDYLPVHGDAFDSGDGGWFNHFRFQAGGVFRFGHQ